MELTLSFNEINWLSVFVAALVAFALGAVWYTPLLFGKIWQRLIMIPAVELERANMFVYFLSTLVLFFIAALFMDSFLGVDSNAIKGFSLGLIISVFWIGTSLAINDLFSRKKFKLFLIDAGYFVVAYALMGIVLGAW